MTFDVRGFFKILFNITWLIKLALKVFVFLLGYTSLFIKLNSNTRFISSHIIDCDKLVILNFKS